MADLVVLLDVDNTLLDNDSLRARLEDGLVEVLGEESAGRFWEKYEEVRLAKDMVDLPETIERFLSDCPGAPDAKRVRAAVYDFPFKDFVYPESLQVLRHISSFAKPVILSDGDQMYQRHKIREAGLEAAVGGDVLVYVHKEEEFDDVRARFPAEHYAMVDDKIRIHAALKDAQGDLVTTVMVRQGRYARDLPRNSSPDPDIMIDSIGDLLRLDAGQLMGRCCSSSRSPNARQS